MIIQCQGCAAKYFLPEDKVPATPIKVRCPKCKAVFVLAPKPEPVGATVRDAAPSPAAEAIPPLETPAAAPKPAPKPTPRPAPKAKRGRGKEDRAKRLARVLVSDILEYNRDKRDQALKDGDLMTALSEEIKKSWELYKEKIGPELAGSTNYFKEALNEILADGQEVF
jgi:predicted Zn finger-like uncharacterized protein